MVTTAERTISWEQDGIQNNYPTDSLVSLREAVKEGKSINIHGEAGSGKTTLLKLLVNLMEDSHVIFVENSSSHTPIIEKIGSSTVAILRAGTDPNWTILRSRPDVVFVDGDDSLRASSGISQYDGAEYSDDYLPYQHDLFLHRLLVGDVQVISAGTRTVDSINTHIKEYRPNLGNLDYDIDVRIRNLTEAARKPSFSLELMHLR